MPRFAMAHREGEAPPTYYRIGGLGPPVRVANPAGATAWNTEQEVHQAVQEFGLSNDPEVFVAKISD
jgi:hypothetical protein